MIKLTFKQILDQKFATAISTLWNCPSLDGHSSYRTNRIANAGEKSFAKSKKMKFELEKKYAQTNPETGIPLKDEKGEPIFTTPELKAEFEKEWQQILETETVEIKVNKLDFNSLITIRGIQPGFWDALEPVLTNVPEEL